MIEELYGKNQTVSDITGQQQKSSDLYLKAPPIDTYGNIYHTKARNLQT